MPLPGWKWVKMRPTMPPDDQIDVRYNHLLCFQCLNSHDLFRDTVYSPSWARNFDPFCMLCIWRRVLIQTALSLSLEASAGFRPSQLEEAQVMA